VIVFFPVMQGIAGDGVWHIALRQSLSDRFTACPPSTRRARERVPLRVNRSPAAALHSMIAPPITNTAAIGISARVAMSIMSI
jgi:hypothetical protein